MFDPYAEFQKKTLPNGLTVYAANWPGRPWEALGFIVHSGAQRDPIGFEGTAHFVEHLVSSNCPETQQGMIDFFNECGGTHEFGMTGFNSTYFKCFVPNGRATVEKALSFFGHMLLSAKLEKYVEIERSIIIAEYHRKYGAKYQYDLDAIKHKAVFSGHWLERVFSVLGRPESIGRITQKDLHDYYDEYYVPANISIVGVGGLNVDQLAELLEKSPFGMAKDGKRILPQSLINDFDPLKENRYVFEKSLYSTSAVECVVGAFQSLCKIPGGINHCALNILRNMLQHKLTKELRLNRRWTYSVQATRYNFGPFHELNLNCSSLAQEALPEIERVIEACVSSTYQEDTLFEKEKQCGLASCLMIDQTAQTVRNNTMDDLILNQRITTLQEYRDDIQKTTMEDIRDLLKWLEPKRRWTLICRP